MAQIQPQYQTNPTRGCRIIFPNSELITAINLLQKQFASYIYIHYPQIESWLIAKVVFNPSLIKMIEQYNCLLYTSDAADE